jgi:hypothetical protein
MPVIPVNRVVDRKKWRAEEEERHNGSLTPQKLLNLFFLSTHEQAL